jgi:hypothetical protein
MAITLLHPSMNVCSEAENDGGESACNIERPARRGSIYFSRMHICAVREEEN